MPRIICPFCPHTHDTSDLLCPEHPDDPNFVIPTKYVEDYRRVPPLWLMTFGFSKHGKTTYLSMLAMLLEKLPNVMPGMWHEILDSYTLEALLRIRKEVQEGRQVEMTTLEGTIRPLLFQVNDMPGIPSRCLVLYDVPGQIFDRFDGVEKCAASMKHVNTAWFLVSLPELLEDTRRMSDLFTVYLTGLRKLRVDPRGWNLIVVYTKADKHRFTPDIDHYLANDPLLALSVGDGPKPAAKSELDLALDTYVEELQAISVALEHYTTEHIDGGNAFVAAVRGNGMNLTFAVTSALGQDPRGKGQLVEKARPHRVIDPLLWALQLESVVEEPSFSLVIDAASDANAVYEQELVDKIWHVLSDQGEVTTYFLGQTAPTAAAGQAPPRTQPEHTRPRLVGPLLDSVLNSPPAKVVLVTKGPILDLDEYDSSSIGDRTLLIKVESDFPTSWPNCHVLRPEDDPAIILDHWMGPARKGDK